jgi:hypothetical protein
VREFLRASPAPSFASLISEEETENVKQAGIAQAVDRAVRTLVRGGRAHERRGLAPDAQLDASSASDAWDAHRSTPEKRGIPVSSMPAIHLMPVRRPTRAFDAAIARHASTALDAGSALDAGTVDAGTPADAGPRMAPIGAAVDGIGTPSRSKVRTVR